MITQEILQLITQIGVGNFILTIVSLFVVSSLPGIIERIITGKSNSKKDKQHERDMTFIRTQISNIWDQVKISETTSNTVKETLSNLVQKLEDYIDVMREQNEQRLEEHVYLKSSIENMVASVDSIEKMMRNVMSERDAMKLVSLKMGSVEDFKTRVIKKIREVLNSGQKNGQVEINIKAVINSEWLDLKSEFETFNFPFNMRFFLDKFDKDLWGDGGLFTVIKNIAINDLELERKMETISKQIDMGLRDIQAKLAKYIEESQVRRG